MTALNFPDSPTNGEVYEGYIYDSSDNVWNRLPEAPGINLENLGNVSGTPTAGDSLIYDGSNWLNTPQKNRNLLYNGAMQVHQRGTSVTGITSAGYYTADRWFVNGGSLGTWTQSVENDTPTGSGFAKSFKMECTTALVSPDPAAVWIIEQRLEGQDLQSIAKGTSSAQSLTVSFWVKSNVTGVYVCNLSDADNTRSVSQAYTVSSSATWEKKTITFPADTTGAFDNDNGNSLTFRFWLASGSNNTSGTLNTSWESTVSANRAVGQVNVAAAVNNYWQVTGVQLEVGSVATPFEFKPYSKEFLECCRYFVKTELLNFAASAGHNQSTTQARVMAITPAPMRAVPTVTGYDDIRTNGSDITASAVVAAGNQPPQGVALQLTAVGLVTNQVCVEVDGGTLDAEL
jgi:hypothetical protein